MSSTRDIKPEELKRTIDQLLNNHRPDRYHEDDTAWMEPVITYVETVLAGMDPDKRQELMQALDVDAVIEEAEGILEEHE